MSTLSLPGRYEGPGPGWANGGIIAGTVAGLLDGASDRPVEVRLQRPVPLDTPLEAVHDDGSAALASRGEVLATARHVDEAPPEGPVVDRNAAARGRSAGPTVAPEDHMAPGCFICGPRHPGGLNLQPGWVDEEHTVAATLWEPPRELADERGVLPREIVWGALDCPSWYAGTDRTAALLGTLRGRILSDVRPGEELIVTGWGESASGRKAFAGASLRRPDGELVASSAAIWIYPRRD